MILDSLPLKTPTPATWTQMVLHNLDAFLVDHAGCERKAAASAVSLVSRYSEHPALVEPLTALAREELEHFAQVFRLLQRRGLRLGPDEKDPYVNLLLAGIRPDQKLLGRLIAGAFIEARSCERFKILSMHLPEVDTGLADFYTTLYRSEAGHFRVFVKIAERLFGEECTQAEVQRMAEVETQAMLKAPLRPAVH